MGLATAPKFPGVLIVECKRERTGCQSYNEACLFRRGVTSCDIIMPLERVSCFSLSRVPWVPWTIPAFPMGCSHRGLPLALTGRCVAVHLRGLAVGPSQPWSPAHISFLLCLSATSLYPTSPTPLLWGWNINEKMHVFLLLVSRIICFWVYNTNIWNSDLKFHNKRLSWIYLGVICNLYKPQTYTHAHIHILRNFCP